MSGCASTGMKSCTSPTPAVGVEARDEDVRVREVELLGGPVVAGRPERVEAAAILVEDRAEHARGVERRAAVPVDRAVRADERHRVQVAHEPVLGDREVRALVLAGVGHRSGAAHAAQRPAPLVLVLLRRDGGGAEDARARAVAGEPDPRADARRPGTVWRRAVRSAGTSSRSPASDTPPPITISSGSNVLIALAIPIPSRSPRIRTTCWQWTSPSRAPSTASWPVISSPRASRRPRNDFGCARADSSASRSSARPDASRSSEPVCGKSPASLGAPPARSRPIIVWPSSAALVAPR